MHTFPRPLLAVLALIAAGPLFATDATPTPAMTTVLKLKNPDGAVESLRFDGALAVGEARGYETDAGTPVLVTRSEDGLRIEMADKTIQVALPEAGDHHAGIEADVEKQVRIERHGEPGSETKVVVLRRNGDATIDDAEIDALIDADPEALADSPGDGTGERKVVIVRKHVEEPAAQ